MKNLAHRAHAAGVSGSSLQFVPLVLLAIVGAGLCALLLLGRSRVVVMPVPATPTGATATVPAAPPAPNPAFQRLVGQWLREDGGYILDIARVEPDGKLTATYLNPSPIHVAKAAAVIEDRMVKVGVELRDANYPGCLYTLFFDPTLDQLKGTYFQAAMGETFEVVFVRKQP